jgi:hypothetical protein
MRALGSRHTGDRGEETTVRRTIIGFIMGDENENYTGVVSAGYGASTRTVR